MTKGKRDALEAAGFRMGNPGDFLGLTDEECRIVENRLVEIRRKVQDTVGTQPAGVQTMTTPQWIAEPTSERAVHLLIRAMLVLLVDDDPFEHQAVIDEIGDFMNDSGFTDDESWT